MKPKRFFAAKTSLFGTPLRFGTPVFVGFVVMVTGLSADAGDILRGNSSAKGKPNAAASGTALTRAATDTARANAKDVLRRSGQTLKALRAMQDAARAAAAKGPNNLGPNLPDVPDGLKVGGLNPSTSISWSGANQPVETSSGGNVNVTIKQNAQQALLQWQTFNVGKKTTLTFDQSAGGQNVGQWIAFNQVNDPTGNPTQILGNIKADGQVYLINRNGVIFGGSSQVSARSLTVSALPINTNLISQGLLNNPDAQFLFSGVDIPAGINGTEGFFPEKPMTADGKYGDVVVQKGAILQSPTNSAKVGGRITLVGPNVVNQGTILTPDGQAILAAGLQVGFDGHSSSDPSLRGLDVFVGEVSDPVAGLYSGTASQDGVIEAARGSITLAGRDVSQNGGLVSTTSVSLNGRIDLQAQYNAVSNRATASAQGAIFLFKDTGSVSLGPDSTISILPEYSSKETTIGTELSLRSQVNMTGKTIRMEAGSSLVAPNGAVILAAGTRLFEQGTLLRSTFLQTGGQVYLEAGAKINVAGSVEVPVSVDQNIISVDLRSAELADSPLQRLGILRNATVQVDIRETGDGWIGTPLADVSGFANLIQRTVGQLTVNGGSVTISAGDSVVMQKGSNIDVSGGSISYKGGTVKTTRLITGGRLVDIGKATPDLVYDAIYDGDFIEANDKFQIRNVYKSPLSRDGSSYEADYIQGAAGGGISLSAASMALDGGFLGVTETGEKQRDAPPGSSSLSFSFFAQDKNYPSFPKYSPAPPKVVFGSGIEQAAADPFELDTDGNPLELREDRKELVVLSPGLFTTDGFGSLTVDNHDGEILVPKGVDLRALDGGSITLKASNITVDGYVTARGGNLAFSTFGLTYDEINVIKNTVSTANPVVEAGGGEFILGSTGSINASGLRVDDRLNSDIPAVSSLYLDGGSLKIEGYSASLAEGGLLNVSGGAAISAKGRTKYGDAGSLVINAGSEIGFSSTLGGLLVLGSDISGFSGSKSGSLSITGPAFRIGGNDISPGVLPINPERFSEAGFGIISLTGIGLTESDSGEFTPGITIAENTVIRPVVAGWLGKVNGMNRFVLNRVIREEGVRDPVKLSFNSSGASFRGQRLTYGDVIVGAGTVIETDAQGSVSLVGDTVTLRGTVITPGGSIIIAGDVAYPNDGEAQTLALPTVHLAASARLSAKGKTVLVENAYGLREGAVIGGGSISVAGNIVAEGGSVLDVSGTKGTLDLQLLSSSLNSPSPNSIIGNKTIPVRIGADAGTVSLEGSELLFSDATLIGRAGSVSAIGGSLNVSSGRFIPTASSYTTADANLVLTQGQQAVPGTNTAAGVGVAVLDENGDIAPQLGHMPVSGFSGGGFNSVSLDGNLRFEGPVSVSIPGSLKVADGGVIYADEKVYLTAQHVSMGQTFRTPTQQSTVNLFLRGTEGSSDELNYSFSPTHGSGILTVIAEHIDIGDLSLQGVGSANFLAKTGDVQGNGTLQIAGDLVFEAGQIYPPTQRHFNVFAYDHESDGAILPGTITIRGGDSRALPYSAGGTLSMYATEITQAGTLRAPIGTINLGWDGSGKAPSNPIAGSTLSISPTKLLTLASGSQTSVSAVDPVTGKALVIPYGISLDGEAWIDPAGNDVTYSGLPAKSVNLASIDLVTAEGSNIDISGGGDLYAYRWISGNGGTADILDAPNSFAVIPGYAFNYSPYAPFNNDSSAENLDGNPGYVESSLKVGDQVTLATSKNLRAGTYTLLPARYALLPGARLITTKGGLPVSSVKTSEGSTMVSGYLSNNLDTSRKGQTVISRFEVATSKVVRNRSLYQDLLANTNLRDAALSQELAVPRLPMDAGYLAFSSTSRMTLSGRVSSLTPVNGRGSVIDINSSSDILINADGLSDSATGLVLSARSLNSFGAESLLVGGLRNFDQYGATVTVNTNSVTLDSAGHYLMGTDIILVSGKKITVGENSGIATIKSDVALDPLFLGDPDIEGSGDGALVRVSANASGEVSRLGIGSSTLPNLVIGLGSQLSGGSIVLDSSAGTNLSDSSRLLADDLFLNSGQVVIGLNNPGVINSTTGLVLSGNALSSLQNSAKSLSLLSYSTIDVYGAGTVGSLAFQSLSLQSSAIRGFNAGTESVTFSAAKLSIGNGKTSKVLPPLVAPLDGSLFFDGDQITLGSGIIDLDGYSQIRFSAAGGILTNQEGALHTSGNLALASAQLTGSSASKYVISSAGMLEFSRQFKNGSSAAPGGFGADLTLEGASVKVNGDVFLPSGRLTLHATSGDITVGDDTSTKIDLAGTSSLFIDSTRYTSGGSVKLLSDAGSVRIGSAADIDVSARDGGGDAGLILVKAPLGIFDLAGNISGNAGTNGAKGGFSLDVGRITGGSLTDIDALLNAGNFTLSREYRIRSGDVNIDGYAKSHIYRVSSDAGNIVVSGIVDASGRSGGGISLMANGSLTIAAGSLLDASAIEFDSAGKGGSVTLEAGNQSSGASNSTAMLNLQNGSTINLSVAAANSTSESLGKFTGTLHLRAPRNVTNTDLQVGEIGSSVSGASSILVEGVKLYGLTGAGIISSTLQTSIKNDAAAFLGTAGSSTFGYTTMLGRLNSLQPTLELILAPGVEIYNLNGDLTLGSATSATTSDWNLEKFRFGPKSSPGVLTLRASEDIVLYNALSDGFSGVVANNNNGNSTLWLAPLMDLNKLLPANTQSWSYRFSAGSDLSAADFGAVLDSAKLDSGKGSFLLGKNYGNAASYGSGANQTTATSIRNRYQVVRTGSGDIDIHAGRDVKILNQFASIYSAGTLVRDPTKVFEAGDFVLPQLIGNQFGLHPTQGSLLGAVQQPYFVQYSMAGGNVSISASGDIARMTRNSNSATSGTLIEDSSRQLPNNWLYRRGFVDPVTGAAGVGGVDDGFATVTDDAASTTWWVDFSNFFEGVGTLGGGNILLSAGNDVKNVDAVAPTNARMASGIPSATKLVEMGGGDVTVIAGRNIDGGVYYVERGKGILEAGGQITTNATRSPSRGIIASLTNPITFDSNTWLATTLFLGKGSFDVQASGDLLLGQVANLFLMPQGLNNKYWYKTYFSTYSPDSGVNVVSLGGDITHRTQVSLPTESASRYALEAWIGTQQSISAANGAANFQPWLRIAETRTAPFASVLGLMAPSLRSTALAGSVKLTGNITLSPSASGQLELLARDSISGLQPSGFINSLGVQRYIVSTVNLSDSDPGSIPGISTPYAYQQVVGRPASALRLTDAGKGAGFLDAIDGLFSETGSTSGVLESEQALHAPGLLHAGDADSVRVYSLEGDIDGFNLFTPKETRVIAGNDIGDIGFYFQNVSASDVSVVSAGRDLTIYDENTKSRVIEKDDISSNSSIRIRPLAGDIQISGPGNLQVLAGRDIDLGLGSGNTDGTGSGITSIGNGRNPYLPFDGASLTVGAGIGPSPGLAAGGIDFTRFIADFVRTEAGNAYLSKIAPGFEFDELSLEEQTRLALEIFYLTLRDTGRDYNDPESPSYRNYDSGFEAIKALFPESVNWDGEILTQSRDIRTRSGGDISILLPGGGLKLANTVIGNPLTPPGIVTESGGNISIFTDQDVDIGIGRIFTLRGGNAIIWSSKGDIAAGSASRTVSAAPPTRVIIDPQSAEVATDLAGLATGGGIGVLASVKGVAPGDVDLIAPAGTIDAGDAGIRVSGNINIAAATVLNAGNISVGGTSTGAPSTTVSSPSVASVTSASNASAAASSTAAATETRATESEMKPAEEKPSLITVEVIGYGGASDSEDEDDESSESSSTTPSE